MSTIAAGTTSGTALVTSGDTTGQLVLQTNGTTTALTIGTNQVVTLAQPLPATSGGTGLTSPGANGNILTSNGTTWTSAAPAPSAGVATATASGSITSGQPVVVNANGTVSQVAATGTAYSIGSLVQTYSGGISALNSWSIYHPIEDKYLFFNASGGGNMTVWVGTVSGTSISFTTQNLGGLLLQGISATYVSGTNRIYLFGIDGINGPSVYTLSLSGTTITNHGRTGIGGGFPVSPNYQTSVTYDSLNNRLFFFYDDNSGNILYYFGTPGTTSVTSITGSYTAVSSAKEFISYYDSVAQRILLLYRDNSNFGQSRVINGSGPSAGSAVAFNSGSTSWAFSAAFDSVASKWLICFGDQSIAGGRPSGIVATVGSTAATFGTKVQMGETASGVDFQNDYSSTGAFVGVAYANGTNIVFRTGTVSGTSVTFSSTNVAVNFNDSVFRQLLNVPSSARFVLNAYGSGFGGVGAYSAVIQAATTTYNLTSENFIGFANGTVSNGQTATIQTVGALNSGQTSLTPGETYYVQRTGGIGLSPSTPSVIAGTSLSSTSILVKG